MDFNHALLIDRTVDNIMTTTRLMQHIHLDILKRNSLTLQYEVFLYSSIPTIIDFISEKPVPVTFQKQYRLLRIEKKKREKKSYARKEQIFFPIYFESYIFISSEKKNTLFCNNFQLNKPRPDKRIYVLQKCLKYL